MSFQPSNSLTAFLATTEVFPKDDVQRLVKQTSNYTDISQAMNVREIAIYQDNQSLITGQQFSDPANNQRKKYTFRKMFYFGAIAAGATLTIPHGITDLVQLTKIYGTCITDIVDYRPIPYASEFVVGENISIKADATNVIISVGLLAPNITSGIAVMEYLLN